MGLCDITKGQPPEVKEKEGDLAGRLETRSQWLILFNLEKNSVVLIEITGRNVGALVMKPRADCSPVSSAVKRIVSAQLLP